MKKWILLGLLLGGFFHTTVEAQKKKERVEVVNIDGNILKQMITEDGDTILLANLDDVSVTSPRKFDNRDDYLRYLKYRYYAAKVYPYAKDAIRIFRETEEVTTTMKKGKQRQYIRKLSKELKEEFEDPLKNLTKTQGKILVKMIERELDKSMYDLIKGLRGSFNASYWSTMSRFYGYRLKEVYQEGDDPILDAVLEDFDISHPF